MKHHNNLNDLNALLCQLEGELAASGKQGRFDIHKISESVVCGILKELYGWTELRNVNEQRGNYPGIDLADDEQRIAVQVTTSRSLQKIVDTIGTFLSHGQHRRYSRLIVLVLGKKQVNYSERAIKEACRGRFEFLANRDVLDLSMLCTQAMYCSPERVAGALRIVKTYFQEECAVGVVASAFRIPTESAFEARHLVVTGRQIVARDCSVSLEIAAPCPTDMSMKAALSLARSELKGVEFQIGSSELVQWLTWRLHAEPYEERPYAPRIPGERDRFVLSTAGACLVLLEHEVHNLDWVLGAAAKPLIEAARDFCDQWRIHRFERAEEQEGQHGRFPLVRAEPDLWRAVLRFARAYDFARGDSEWHIFDGTGANLKVLETGRVRLICDAFNQSIRFAENDDVLITWTAHHHFSPDGMWDAETAHDWLLEELLPRVNAHCGRTDTSNFGPSSAATHEMPSALLPAQHTRMLEKSVMSLQYFFAERVDVPVARYMRSILRVAHRLVGLRPAFDEGYVRGNFALHEDEPVADGLSRRLAEPPHGQRRFHVDLALRGLLAVTEHIEHAGPDVLRFAETELQPLWGFYQDHMVLRHWREK